MFPNDNFKNLCSVCINGKCIRPECRNFNLFPKLEKSTDKYYHDYNKDYKISIVIASNNKGLFTENYIEADNFIKDGHIYYQLPHNTEYIIKMCNGTNSKVNAYLKIDGIHMGKWKIDSLSEIFIENSSNNNKKFIFMDNNMWGGNLEVNYIDKNNNGLVEVQFIPEIDIYNLERHDIFTEDRLFSTKINFRTENIFNRSSLDYLKSPRVFEDTNRSVIKRIRIVVQKRRDFNNYYNDTLLDSRILYSDDLIPPPLNSDTNNIDEYNL